MSATKLLRHGENIKPEYVAKPGKPGPAGKSTNAARPDGKVSGTVTRYRKKKQASDVATALGLIKTTYPDAIEYTGIPSNLRGLLMLSAFSITGFFLYVGIDQIRISMENGEIDAVEILFFTVAIGLLTTAVYSLIYGIRHEFFRPVDEPVIFDRKNRKIYRLFRETYPAMGGLLRQWPMRAVEYDWDLVDVEHRAVLAANTATISRHHSLLFIVRKSKTDATIIDSFTVVHGIALGELTVGPVWEHIRRFMEADGPHLPAGEVLHVDVAPKSLWQSLEAVGPFGAQYVSWWKEHPFMTVFLHLISPFILPIFLFWGLFNWLSHKTAFQAQWPQEVLDTVTQS
jgi:hypothetical protein